MNSITYDRIAVRLVVVVLFHPVAVPPVETIVGAYPDETLLILRDTGRSIAAEPVHGRNMMKLKTGNDLRRRLSAACTQGCEN